LGLAANNRKSHLYARHIDADILRTQLHSHCIAVGESKMASLDLRNGTYSVVFRFGGKKFSRSLKTSNLPEAETRRLNLERTIREVMEGRKEIPDGADVPIFLLSDGKLGRPIHIQSAAELLTLEQLFEAYFSSLADGSKEVSTLDSMHRHKRHLFRLMGKGFAVQTLSVDDLQRYVSKRSKEKTKWGERVTANTINKAIVTFRTVWNWGVRTKRLLGRFPSRKDLTFPKETEKPSFQTRSEIERIIELNSLSKREEQELWSSLYLQQHEVDELLDFVEKSAVHPWLYPAFTLAAHTGLRRSELVRCRVSDVGDDVVSIREKKRVRGKGSTRRVPMSSRLRTAMTAWLNEHPGGEQLFCGTRLVRSRNRRGGVQAVSVDTATDHFNRTLRNGPWKVVSGWHCFRHSFISNLASQGVDQRLIDEFVGHTSEEVKRRYRHLLPDVKQAAIRSVLG